MSKFTNELVDFLADRLIIGLTPEENERVLKDFEEIDKQIDLINKIPNIKSVEPMTHTLDDFEFELREDIAEESVTHEEILSNCDDHDERCVIVPKVVG